MGGAGILKVKYRNVTDRALTIMRPSDSPRVHVSAKCETSDGGIKGRSLGTSGFVNIKAPDGTEMEGSVIPNDTSMQLGARKEFTFEVPVDNTWGAFIGPGLWAIDYKDNANYVRGQNTAHITFVYRPETVDSMLKFVKDTKVLRSFRAECSEWMLMIKPDTKLSFRLRTKTPEGQAEENRLLDEDQRL